EQAGIVDAQRVHPPMPELDVAQLPLRGLLRSTHWIARDAPAHLLETDRVGGNDAAAAFSAAAERELPQDIVLHEGEKLVQAFVLVMVRIDVDDEHVVKFALLRLLAGMRKQPPGVELFDGDAPAAVGDEVHGASPRKCEDCAKCIPVAAPAKAGSATVRDCGGRISAATSLALALHRIRDK